MIRRSAALLALATLAALALAPGAGATAPSCEKDFASECFAIEGVSASLSTYEAGAHPDLTISFATPEDPESPLDEKGLHDSFAPIRKVRIDAPPGLVGDPNTLGIAQQCTSVELTLGECPNGSQIGIVKTVIFGTGFATLNEPLYMMVPAEGSGAIARIGFAPVPGAAIYANITVRSEGDFGLRTEIEVPDLRTSSNDLIASETTLWGVPAAPEHDYERCTPEKAFKGCTEAFNPPGGAELPFLTNPTRCGVPLEVTVAASSYSEPDRFDAETVTLPYQIHDCDKLAFDPSLQAEPTSHATDSPTGLALTLRLPKADGVDVLEPSQIKDIRITMPPGLAINPAAADGQGVCSSAQVRLGENAAAECPDNAKMAATEFEVGGLPRRMKGAIYLREPEPGNPFRVWIVADDLGAHIKLEGQLHVDKETGQIESIVLDNPQVPLREVKLFFKSGFRAPLVTPDKCGTYYTHYELTPWSGGPAKVGDAPMQITEGCDTGGFDPKLSAGGTIPLAGQHTPFHFILTREDGEQNPASLEMTLPPGFAATFAGVARCEGADAVTGHCPAASAIGSVSAAVGAGPTPLRVPQAGKRPAAVYLGGPYEGAPTSIVAVVPKQAGPFDFGDEVVRSAVYVDPVTAQATVKSDPFPQQIEGIPVGYRELHVAVDRPGFTLNPTSCEQEQTRAKVTSAEGAVADLSAPFAATRCSLLGFKPRLGLKLKGGTRRGAFPALRLVYRPRAGDANLKHLSLRFPKSEFIEQGHFRTICTRVQFAAGEGFGSQCPAGSVYGRVKVFTPLLDEPLTGLVYLRSSNHNLPDAVLAIQGPPSLPVKLEVPTRIDSVKGGLRVTSSNTPDAPITAVVVDQQGGQKGLFVNSTNLCAAKHRATVNVDAHNGRTDKINPVVRAVKCKKAHRKRHKGHRKKNGGKHKGKKH